MWTKAHRREQNTKCCSAETGSRSSSSNMIARSDQIGHAMNLYSAGDMRCEVIQHRQLVVGDAPSCFAFRLAADPRSHQIEELMGMGATQHSLPLALLQIGIVAHVPENERVVRMHGHDALAGGASMLVHVEDCLEEHLEIVFTETHFLREVGADESLADVQPIRDETLASHRAQFVFRLLPLPLGEVRRADLLALDGVVGNGH